MNLYFDQLSIATFCHSRSCQWTENFVQERMKPQEEKNEEERTKVSGYHLVLALTLTCHYILRSIADTFSRLSSVLGGWSKGKPFVCWQPGGDHWWQSCNSFYKVCGLFFYCLRNFFIFSSVGSEHYVSILSFVDKDQLEPGCTVLLNHKVFHCLFVFLTFAVILILTTNSCCCTLSQKKLYRISCYCISQTLSNGFLKFLTVYLTWILLRFSWICSHANFVESILW